MSTETLNAQPDNDSESLDPALVEAYLRDHPGFFRNRPTLLTSLELPHGGEGAVSLVERQVSLLRERNIDMRKRLAEIGGNAEKNEALFAATRDLVLSLISANDLATRESVFRDAMKSAFAVPLSALHWLPGAEDVVADAKPIDANAAQTLSGLTAHGKSLCGVLRGEEMAALFETTPSEGSAAVAPLMHEGRILGIVAVGDRNVSRYQAGDGTLFLDYLAEVLMRLAVAGAGSAP
jgi:uncharacterized protein YigA (DUF484 family)